MKSLWKTSFKKIRVNIFGFSEKKVEPLLENKVDYFPAKNRIITEWKLTKFYASVRRFKAYNLD
ncbi:hypothetical protein EO95_02575 [Methanosarcina sp. 1.H.T.1A.1]|nr:hypothetical protein EO95_02575 [Methanosarcina sp. 1.H.T.1A.1]